MIEKTINVTIKEALERSDKVQKAPEEQELLQDLCNDLIQNGLDLPDYIQQVISSYAKAMGLLVRYEMKTNQQTIIVKVSWLK